MLTSEFDDALVMASSIHRDQSRKGTDVPYISHLLAVTALVIEHGGTEEEAIAALLHDAAEDQGATSQIRKIRDRFGDAIADCVAACSDTLESPKPPWRERKKAFVVGLYSAPYSVRLIVAADKLHNVLAISDDFERLGEKLWTRFNGGREGTLWYYRTVVDTLRSAARPDETRLNALMAKLDAAFARLETDAQELRAISPPPVIHAP